MKLRIYYEIDVGEMGKKNSMENATIAISMVIEKMNGKGNLILKENFKNARNIGTNPLNARLR